MYWNYLKYVIRHKWFVFIACCKHRIIWRGIMHDMSKFRPSEFIPYAKYFYGQYDDGEVEKNFNKAWLLHIHRNPHHWKYWVLQNDTITTQPKLILIPIQYLKEMGCDWLGAEKAITGRDSIKEWYLKNKNQIQLNKTSREWIEKNFIKISTEQSETNTDSESENPVENIHLAPTAYIKTSKKIIKGD